MIRLYDWNRIATSKNEALTRASNRTGFNKEDFKCEVVREPKRVGLFKKEDGIFRCWYEYQGMNSDKRLDIADATLHFDITQKKILVLRFGYMAYEIDYSDLVDYEMVICSSNRTYTVSSKNKALKGAALFGITGAIVGAADTETISETVELAELVIRLKFKNKEPFEIITCDQKCNTENEEWRDILDQSKAADKFFKELLKEM